MKKLIMAVAVVCAAVATQAATYKWTVNSYWVSADNLNPLQVAVYAFDGNAFSMSTLTTALAGGDLTQLDNAIANGVVNAEGAITLTGSGLTDDGATPPYAKMYALVMDKSSGTYSSFYTADMGSVKITDAVTSGGAEFTLGDPDNGLVTGTVGGAGWAAIGSSPAPEPTSGLLLLIGMAGLALKRKRA